MKPLFSWRRARLPLLAIALACTALLIPRLSSSVNAFPEFASQSPERWVNTAPISAASLRGKVVLVEIWTSI